MSGDKNSSKYDKSSFESDKNSYLDESDKSYTDKLVEEVDESNKKNLIDENKEEMKNNESLNINENQYNFLIAEKINSFLKSDLEKKYPIIAILGVIFGLILLVISIILFSGTNSEKIADNVSFQENGMVSVLIGSISFIILGLSIFCLFTKKSFFASIFKPLVDVDSLKLDENLNSEIKNNESHVKDETDLNDVNNDLNEVDDTDLNDEKDIKVLNDDNLNKKQKH
ncbi:MAG: hypothetical protein LBD03_05775 [Methanobrevibacter sp.]|jgi:hypothetical protein|nr:hypothetical protein [Candidatus Methanovirga procula]